MVEFIDINGIKYPIVINFYVIGLFQQETGKSFDSLSDIGNNLYLVEPLMYYALKMGSQVNKQEFPFTRDDMPILLSDDNIYRNFSETISKFFPAITEKQPTKKKKV